MSEPRTRWCDNCQKRVIEVYPDSKAEEADAWRPFAYPDTYSFCEICHEYLGAYTWTDTEGEDGKK